MVSIELVRAAGMIADALDIMGFSTEQMILIADLLKQQAAVRDKYTPVEAPEATRTNSMN